MHVSQMRVRTVLGAVVMSALVVGNARAADRFVSTTGSDTANDCLSSLSPCHTVGYALTQAASGDMVKVAGGSYRENVTVSTATTLTLSGGWANDFSVQDPVATTTTLRAATQLPVLTVLANEVSMTLTVDGLTIERGSNFCSNCVGGGMSAQVSAGGTLSVALNRVVLLHNQAGFGGGLGAGVVGVGSSLAVTVTDTMVLANSGSDGGGMGYAADANASLDVSLDHVLFRRNRALPLDGYPGHAGGLSVGVAASGPHQLLVQNSTFDSNSANRLLPYHRAAGGGGMALSGGDCGMGSCQFKVMNSVFVHNRAQVVGAIEVFGGADLVNVTATRNSSSYQFPGGVYMDYGTVRDSILWRNRGSAGYPQDLHSSPGGNVGVDHSDVLDKGGALTDLGGNINADPLFVSGSDIHLRAGSPAIDAGTCAGAPTTDFEGDPRPTGAGCDMGADEFVP